MSPLVLSGWYVQYMLILTPLCCLQVEELLYFSLSVAQLPDLSLWHHHYRVSAVQPWYWRWAGLHEIISMNSKWAGVLINMNPWKHEWFWRRLVGPPLSDYITCMWHVCTSMFSLLFCMLSPPHLHSHSPSVSHPSPPWWAAWFAGECVIWISTSVSVYQPDSWDVAAQKFLFSLPSTPNPVDFFLPLCL